MAVALVSKGTAAHAGAASGTPANIAPTLPASLAANDVCIAQMIVGTVSGQSSPARFGCPSDWEEIHQFGFRNSATGWRGCMGWFWKRMAGGESGTITFSTEFSSSNESSFHGNIYRLTGCPTTGLPWEDVRANAFGDGSTTITWRAVDVGGSERTLLAFVGQLDDTPGASTPTGYSATVAIDTNTTNQDTQLAVFDFAGVSAGTEATAAGGETAGWATLHMSFHASAQAEVSPPAFRGLAHEEVSDTTLTLTPTITIGVGQLALLAASSDNTGTTAGADTTEHTVTDSVGNTWTKLKEGLRSAGAAADGATVSTWMSKLTTALTPSDTITLTLGTARTAKTMILHRALLAPNRRFEAVGSAFTHGTGANPSLATGTISSGTYLIVGAVGIESGDGTAILQDAFMPTGQASGLTQFPLDVMVGTDTSSTVGNSCILGMVYRQAITEFTYAITRNAIDWAAVLTWLQSADDSPAGGNTHTRLTLLGVG